MKLKTLVKKLYYDMRIRFLFVGCLNTAIGFGVDSLVCLLFQSYTSVAAEIYQAVAIVTGTVIGAINSYFWNKYFTFRSKKKSWREIGRFALVYLGCFLFSYLSQLGLQALFMYEDKSWQFYAVKFFVLVVQTVASWFGQKYFSFRKGKGNDLTVEEKTETEEASSAVESEALAEAEEPAQAEESAQAEGAFEIAERAPTEKNEETTEKGKETL